LNFFFEKQTKARTALNQRFLFCEISDISEPEETSAQPSDDESEKPADPKTTRRTLIDVADTTNINSISSGLKMSNTIKNKCDHTSVINTQVLPDVEACGREEGKFFQKTKKSVDVPEFAGAFFGKTSGLPFQRGENSGSVFEKASAYSKIFSNSLAAYSKTFFSDAASRGTSSREDAATTQHPTQGDPNNTVRLQKEGGPPRSFITKELSNEEKKASRRNPITVHAAVGNAALGMGAPAERSQGPSNESARDPPNARGPPQNTVSAVNIEGETTSRLPAVNIEGPKTTILSKQKSSIAEGNSSTVAAQNLGSPKNDLCEAGAGASRPVVTSAPSKNVHASAERNPRETVFSDNVCVIEESSRIINSEQPSTEEEQPQQAKQDNKEQPQQTKQLQDNQTSLKAKPGSVRGDPSECVLFQNDFEKDDFEKRSSAEKPYIDQTLLQLSNEGATMVAPAFLQSNKKHNDKIFNKNSSEKLQTPVKKIQKFPVRIIEKGDFSKQNADIMSSQNNFQILTTPQKFSNICLPSKQTRSRFGDPLAASRAPVDNRGESESNPSNPSPSESIPSCGKSHKSLSESPVRRGPTSRFDSSPRTPADDGILKDELQDFGSSTNECSTSSKGRKIDTAGFRIDNSERHEISSQFARILNHKVETFAKTTTSRKNSKSLLIEDSEEKALQSAGSSDAEPRFFASSLPRVGSSLSSRSSQETPPNCSSSISSRSNTNYEKAVPDVISSTSRSAAEDADISHYVTEEPGAPTRSEKKVNDIIHPTEQHPKNKNVVDKKRRQEQQSLRGSPFKSGENKEFAELERKAALAAFWKQQAAEAEAHARFLQEHALEKIQYSNSIQQQPNLVPLNKNNLEKHHVEQPLQPHSSQYHNINNYHHANYEGGGRGGGGFPFFETRGGPNQTLGVPPRGTLAPPGPRHPYDRTCVANNHQYHQYHHKHQDPSVLGPAVPGLSSLHLSRRYHHGQINVDHNNWEFSNFYTNYTEAPLTGHQHHLQHYYCANGGDLLSTNVEFQQRGHLNFPNFVKTNSSSFQGPGYYESVSQQLQLSLSHNNHIDNCLNPPPPPLSQKTQHTAATTEATEKAANALYQGGEDALRTVTKRLPVHQ